MVTNVGKAETVQELLHDLIQLDYDAIAAYDAAIERLETESHRSALAAFREDHARHVSNLSPLLRQMGGEVPDGGDAKQMLTKGKVAMGGLFGDKAILEAMRTNEDDTNTAYERAAEHEGATADVRQVLTKNLSDERRHCEWIRQTLEKL